MKNFFSKIGVLMFILSASMLMFSSCDKSDSPDKPADPTDEPTLIDMASYRPSVYVISVAEDTIITSGSTDAFTLDIGSFFSPIEYDFVMFADSLTGGTAGTATLQFSPAMTGSDWYDVSSSTINGVTTYTRFTGDLVRGRLRLSVAAASSTQTTAVDIEGAAVNRISQ